MTLTNHWLYWKEYFMVKKVKESQRRREKHREVGFIESPNECDQLVFPLIHKLLKICWFASKPQVPNIIIVIIINTEDRKSNPHPKIILVTLLVIAIRTMFVFTLTEPCTREL
jgi:hypothetical protein